MDLARAIVPLVPGLMIVTAVEDMGDDYESIKVILASGPQGYWLSYSSIFKSDYQLKRVNCEREVSSADHQNAGQYRLAFANGESGPARGTTAISLSTAKFRELKHNGETRIGVVLLLGGFDGVPEPTPQDIDLRRDATPVEFPILVNNRMTRLPAIHALYRPGKKFRDSFPNEHFEFQEGFTFLDDDANPIALRWSYFVTTLEVVRINNVHLNLPATPESGGEATPTLADGAGQGTGRESGEAAAPSLAEEVEQGLTDRGSVEVYGIYFDTGSAAIRPESEPAIAAIAEALRKNGGLKVSIEGHTDNQGGEQYNLELSRKRAEAVRAVLIEKHNIDKDRLSTRGHGFSKPKADNSTLLGRAQNRRVELVRK